jgi:hypothetical protein
MNMYRNMYVNKYMVIYMDKFIFMFIYINMYPYMYCRCLSNYSCTYHSREAEKLRILYM